ncbi:MAG: TatD family hydrolase [Bariatricus sp.]|nr:TatD family hydrolase [Bariatricus sp.]
MIFDTHAHYDDGQFQEDRDELLASMPSLGVGTIVNVSATYESCTQAVELAKKYPHVYAAVGIHPDEVGVLDDDKFSKMKELFKEEKVVAVGEIGLDYYWDNESHEVQRKWFVRQLELAKELDLPVLIHSRDAAADTMYVMENYAKGLTGVIHCYSYSKEMALEYVKMGFYIGIGGVVTFKNSKKMKEVVEAVPMDRILLETDCPYLAPEPLRGKRNQSSYLTYVVKKIAEIKGISEEEVIAVTEVNARRMYRLDTV